MKNLAKGALLNAFVLPGSGQLAQKRYLRGWVYIAGVIICVLVLFRVIFTTAQSTLTNSADGMLSSNKAELTEQVTNDLLQNGGSSASYAVVVIILIWIIALVDSIATGRSLDRKSGAHSEKHTK